VRLQKLTAKRTLLVQALLACQAPSSLRKTRRGREPQVHERERERTSGKSSRATLALLEILKV